MRTATVSHSIVRSDDGHVARPSNLDTLEVARSDNLDTLEHGAGRVATALKGGTHR
jgi:hypothetical protein